MNDEGRLNSEKGEWVGMAKVRPFLFAAFALRLRDPVDDLKTVDVDVAGHARDAFRTGRARETRGP